MKPAKLLQPWLRTTLCAGLIFTVATAAADTGYHEPNEHDAKERFAFALWGDMPYAKNNDDAKIPALIRDMNAHHLAFTVFDGDTKDGSSLCSDETIGHDAIARFNALRAATVYVPGDNEWTDCHRINNGGYDPLERLAYIRASLFDSPLSFGKQKMRLTHQGELGGAYSENTRWVHHGVVFVGLNVPGSNNNKVNDGACLSSKSERTLADCAAANAEYADRNAHNLAWVKQAFQLARERHAPGIMFVIQANPGFDDPQTYDINERTLPQYNGYNDLINTLVEETRAFTGQVVLVHGDSHYFMIDKPLLSQSNLLENFTRVETFGSPNVHWVKVTVTPHNRQVFHFDPMIVPGN